MKFVPSRAEDVTIVACERLAEIKYYSQVIIIILLFNEISLSLYFLHAKQMLVFTVLVGRAVSGH